MWLPHSARLPPSYRGRLCCQSYDHFGLRPGWLPCLGSLSLSGDSFPVGGCSLNLCMCGPYGNVYELGRNGHAEVSRPTLSAGFRRYNRRSVGIKRISRSVLTLPVCNYKANYTLVSWPPLLSRSEAHVACVRGRRIHKVTNLRIRSSSLVSPSHSS